MVYYNENDRFSAQWLRNLELAERISIGTIDERSIKEVEASDLAGYERCHFFAGIAGWDLALNLAGWGSGEVWTGSCPCQPFSVAGKRKGNADDRHLWPVWRSLIEECRPATIFGEQVASADGRAWLSGVRADLEALGYAVGAADLCAASVGAPHIRQRLWWVGHTVSPRSPGRRLQSGAQPSQGNTWAAGASVFCRDGVTRRAQPGVHPLAHGISGRVGRIRAYGNAIVPQVAAEFVKAFMEVNR